jgi:DNA helicase-2/ATP-dependent DNA helicase PcrA
MVVDLDDIDITGIDEYPPDTSVKLYGPPGTGKTTQSAARVGRLLRDDDYTLNDVAWCTYRKSLAHDTLQRLAGWGVIDDVELERPTEGATRFIGTTHAVANRAVGGLPDPVEPWQRNDFCDRMGMQYWADKPWEDTAGKLLFRVFDWLKGNCYNPARPEDIYACPFVEDLRANWNGDIPSAWNRWEDYKGQHEVIDFYEMLEAPVEDKVAPTDQILVIDEYHDATPLIAKLSEQWIDAAKIVIVAGDPCQVVNSFDGADPRFFEQLDLPEVLLDTTYRVPEEHWQKATLLLGKAHDPPPVTRHSRGQFAEYRSPRFSYSRETGWAVPKATRPASPGALIAKHGTDMLFLTRMQMQADGVGRALEEAGIIYYSQSDLHGWNTDRGAERLALYNALQKIRGFAPGHFDHDGQTQYGLGNYTDSPANPDTVVLDTPEIVNLLTYTNAKYLAQSRAETTDICDGLENAENTASLTSFNEWVEPEFWGRHTSGAGSIQRLNKGKLSDRDRRALYQALRANADPLEAVDSIPTGVLTIHASKGKEADDVVVYDGISQRIRQGMDRSEETRRNEWRTWYVALTRAAKRMHIMRGAFRWTQSILPTDLYRKGGEPSGNTAVTDGGNV